MAVTTKIKEVINQGLKFLNLRLDTLTLEKNELRRLKLFEQTGAFSQPIFPILEVFKSMDISPILAHLPEYSRRFNDFENPSNNDVEFTFDNVYFTSPDVEVLYTVLRVFRPKTIIEIGSGNSTKIIRQAIIDGKLKTSLISTDPCPRVDIACFVDKVFYKPVERIGMEIFRSLGAGDILFIDSSHKIETGNDVIFLYLNVIPALPKGVLIHIHDIFLPYEYPKEWIITKRWKFTEQYLLQGILTYTNWFKLLWAGYFLQKSRDDFGQYFPHLNGRIAKSFWLQKVI